MNSSHADSQSRMIAAYFLPHFSSSSSSAALWLAKAFVAAAPPNKNADTAVLDFLATADEWPWQWSSVAVLIVSGYVMVDACRDRSGMRPFMWATVIAAVTAGVGLGHYALETALVGSSVEIPWSRAWSALGAAAATTALIIYRDLVRMLVDSSA